MNFKFTLYIKYVVCEATSDHTNVPMWYERFFSKVTVLPYLYLNCVTNYKRTL